MLKERIEKIEIELAELKALAKKEEEFKDGDWIIVKGATPTELRKTIKCEVRGGNLNWSESESKNLPHAWELHKTRKATPEEIETFLIKEAEKKGFVKGARVRVIEGIENSKYDKDLKSWGMPKISRNEREIDGFEMVENQLVFHATDVDRQIFYTIDALELAPSYPQIRINGYKAEFKDWGLDFNNGCAKIDKRCFIQISAFFNAGKFIGEGNKELTSVNFGSGNFTIKEINEIAEHYKSK